MIKKLSSKFSNKKERDKFRKKTLPKAILVFFGVILAFYFTKNALTPSPKQEDLVEHNVIMTVKVKTVHIGKTQSTLNVNGQTVAVVQIPLKSRTSGKIEKFLKQKGDFVKKDEVILTLSQDDRSAKLSAIKAKVKDAEFRYKTTKELVAQDFESPLTLAKEKSSLEQVQAELKTMQQDIDYTSITAPFDGVFDTRNVEVGDVITTQTEIGAFISLNPMLVQSNLPEKHFGQIKQDTFVKVEFSNSSYIIGKVVYISNLLDTQTRTFLSEVEIENKDLMIGVGQTAKLTFMLEQAEGYYLPNQSLLTLDINGTLGVKVVEDGKVKFVPIEIIKNEESAIWVSGLYDGAKVITLGGEFAEVGQDVNMDEEPADLTSGTTPESNQVKETPVVEVPATTITPENNPVKEVINE